MNPYQSLPPRSFWRSAVAEPEMLAIGGLWTPTFDIGPDDPVLTAGSCFASHIGRALLERGMNWLDAEPAPPELTEAESRARHYGVFSFRTGTIYTAATLWQWLAWAYGRATAPGESWSEDGRHFDPFRPAIFPAGHASAEEMLAARQATFAAIRAGVAAASCLIFTLGLTEAWQDRLDGTTYPVCPGTVRGTFDPERHALRNFTFDDVRRDLTAAIALARAANPGLRILLTVSPVPLTATATGGHALTATTYSKSVLRAVAGQLAQEHHDVDYFPSYEIITGFPFKGVFFAPNLRTVTPEGVDFVMDHFFGALANRPVEAPPARPRPAQPRPADLVRRAQPGRTQPGRARPGRTQPSGEDPYCDDAVLDYYNPRARFLLLGDSHAGTIGRAAKAAGVPFRGGPIGAGREFNAEFFDVREGDVVFRAAETDTLYRGFLAELDVAGLHQLTIPLVSTFGFSAHFFATTENWQIYRRRDGGFAPGFLESRLFDDIIGATARDALAFYRHARALGLRVLAVMPPQRVPAISDPAVFMAAQDSIRRALIALDVEIVDLRAHVTDETGLQRPELCEPDDPIHGNLAFGQLIVADLLARGL